MILLVRHPAVDAGGRCYGRLDVEPADPAAAGLLARRVADRCRDHAGHPPWTVWTSPARRCRSVADALGPHRVDPRLQELDFGDWEGRPWDSVPRASLDAWAADPWHFAPPAGESGHALAARVGAFACECREGNHVVITHGGPLKVLRAMLRGTAIDWLAPPLAPGSITCVGG